jgi:hypothetical protein
VDALADPLPEEVPAADLATAPVRDQPHRGAPADAVPVTGARPPVFDAAGAAVSDRVDPDPFAPEAPRSETPVADDWPAERPAEDASVVAVPTTDAVETPAPDAMPTPVGDQPARVEAAVVDVTATPPDDEDPIEQILREARSQEEAARERELALSPGEGGHAKADPARGASPASDDDTRAAPGPADVTAWPDGIDIDDLFDKPEQGRQRQEG